MVELVRAAEGIFGLFLEYWASSTDRAQAGQLWVDLLQQYQGLIVAIIEEGIRTGEFRPVDASALVWAMMATYDGLAAYATLMPGLDSGANQWDLHGDAVGRSAGRRG